MSARLSTAFPRACSGAMYAAVPMTTPIRVEADVKVGEFCGSAGESSVGDIAFARPKSRTFTVSSAAILMLAGFKSRWTMPRSWAASSASASCRARDTASASGSGPRAIRTVRSSPSANSMTIAGVPSVCSTP